LKVHVIPISFLKTYDYTFHSSFKSVINHKIPPKPKIRKNKQTNNTIRKENINNIIALPLDKFLKRNLSWTLVICGISSISALTGKLVCWHLILLSRLFTPQFIYWKVIEMRLNEYTVCQYFEMIFCLGKERKR
jgi:hypothetical protein